MKGAEVTPDLPSDPPVAAGRPRPFGVGVIDTMVGFPQDPAALYRQLRAVLRDAQSRDEFVMPAQYMFHEIPDNELADGVDPVALVLGELDRHGIDVALVSVSANEQVAARALAEHPDRFVGSWAGDPNKGMVGIRELVAAHETYGIRAVTVFPHGGLPQVPIDAPQVYPIYAKCVELGIP